ncbi:reticulocalbin-2-like [Notechis scutatus]|uniref:Reticulocalbin-2-like n=1 Tax=Notechis scutatus TaxID=8663 RepID=A0A6J1W0W1_9SAUR|nr:reticulocalbin-2-like [Notechis scutatus]
MEQPLLLLTLLAGLGTGLAEHRPDYDREALLGGQDEVEEFSKLSPEEQQKRLKVIISKIDVDQDGFLTEGTYDDDDDDPPTKLNHRPLSWAGLRWSCE